MPSFFVGSLSAAINTDWMRDHNVTTLINVCSARYTPPAGITYLHLPLRDNNEKDLAPAFEKVYPLMRAVGAANEYWSRKPDGAKPPALLIHCQHGRSRSVAILLMFIMRWFREPLYHAVMAMMSARPTMFMAFNFELQLTAFERHEFGMDHNSISNWAGSLYPVGKRPKRAATYTHGYAV